MYFSASPKAAPASRSSPETPQICSEKFVHGELGEPADPLDARDCSPPADGRRSARPDAPREVVHATGALEHPTLRRFRRGSSARVDSHARVRPPRLDDEVACRRRRRRRACPGSKRARARSARAFHAARGSPTPGARELPRMWPCSGRGRGAGDEPADAARVHAERARDAAPYRKNVTGHPGPSRVGQERRRGRARPRPRRRGSRGRRRSELRERRGFGAAALLPRERRRPVIRAADAERCEPTARDRSCRRARSRPRKARRGRERATPRAPAVAVGARRPFDARKRRIKRFENTRAPKSFPPRTATHGHTATR